MQVLTETQEDAVAVLRDEAFVRRYSVPNIFARDGTRAYQRGHSQTVLPPNREHRPRLVQGVQEQIREVGGGWEGEPLRGLEQGARLAQGVQWHIREAGVGAWERGRWWERERGGGSWPCAACVAGKELLQQVFTPHLAGAL